MQMSGKHIKLYEAGSSAESAFFLNEGTVYFYASTVDKYAITGKNLIIGSTEIIMKHLLGTDAMRVETAIADGSSAVKKIPVGKYLAGLGTYSFALNASMVLAKQVHLTGRILHKNMTAFEGDERKTREYATEYYLILYRLKQEYEKRRLPWIKALCEEFEDSLTYKKGEAYSRSAEPALIVTEASLSDKQVEFPRGSVICEEGAPGEEMFILQSGAVDIFVRGVRISTVDEPGTVIGESSLLLAEPRAATLKAKNNVVMTRIRKGDLKEVAEKQQDFFATIAMTLARRHYYIITRIEAVNRSMIEQAMDREASGEVGKRAILSQRAFKDLCTLRDRVEEVVREKKAEFLKDLLEKF
ncbi:MAG: cyclic nucleotide-binding domain-containing protein [Chrysiogenales bacterium]|nr:MAG: cyclic nucleotide-binding domain-containing protein [Chrysiogenales bacterium]